MRLHNLTLCKGGLYRLLKRPYTPSKKLVRTRLYESFVAGLYGFRGAFPCGFCPGRLYGGEGERPN